MPFEFLNAAIAARQAKYLARFSGYDNATKACPIYRRTSRADLRLLTTERATLTTDCCR